MAALLQFTGMGWVPIVGTSRSTAWRWAQEAAARAKALGALTEGRAVGTHTFRHSYVRHLLLHGVPINYVSRWLGHRSIQTTLIYLELVPDPAGAAGNGAVRDPRGRTSIPILLRMVGSSPVH